MSWSISAAPAAPARGAGPRQINIIGLGPAGAILALRAAERGWQVHGYDPGSRPDAAGADAWPAWPATYGAFAPEVPDWADELFSPAEAIRVTPTPGSTKQLGFRYRMMAKGALRAGAAEAVRYAGGSLHAEAMTEEQFADLPGLTVDCRGAATGGALWQIAVGYVLRPVPGSGATLSEALITPTLMDWTASPRQNPVAPNPASSMSSASPKAGWRKRRSWQAPPAPPTLTSPCCAPGSTLGLLASRARAGARSWRSWMRSSSASRWAPSLLAQGCSPSGPETGSSTLRPAIRSARHCRRWRASSTAWRRNTLEQHTVGRSSRGLPAGRT